MPYPFLSFLIGWRAIRHHVGGINGSKPIARSGPRRNDSDHDQEEEDASGYRRRYGGVSLAPAPDFAGGTERPCENSFALAPTFQIVRQCQGGGVTPGRRFAEAFQANGFEVRRYLGICNPRGRRFGIENLQKRFFDRLRNKRGASSQQVIEDGAKRVNIAAGAD